MGQLLAALFAIVLGIAGIPLFLQYQQASNDSVIASVTAQQAQIMNTAVTSYVQQNATTLQSSATSHSPSTITVAMLQSSGLLPSAFSATNPYGQTWTAFVLQPSSGNLQALVSTTGGTAIKDRLGLKIASLIGAVGGFVPTNDSGAYSTPGNSYANAYGAFGGWTMQVGTGSFGVSTGGRPASLLSFFNGALQGNYLYRNAVSGQPQLNTMNTPLVMASTQTLNSACTTTGAIAQDGTGKLLSCQSGVWKSTQSSTGWAGQYTVDLCGSQGNSNNPLTGAASCPSGALSTTSYVHAGSVCVQFFFCYYP